MGNHKASVPSHVEVANQICYWSLMDSPLKNEDGQIWFCEINNFPRLRDVQWNPSVFYLFPICLMLGERKKRAVFLRAISIDFHLASPKNGPNLKW